MNPWGALSTGYLQSLIMALQAYRFFLIGSDTGYNYNRIYGHTDTMLREIIAEYDAREDRDENYANTYIVVRPPADLDPQSIINAHLARKAQVKR